LEDTLIAATAAADISVSHKDIREARQIRDAQKTEPGIVKRVISPASGSGAIAASGPASSLRRGSARGCVRVRAGDDRAALPPDAAGVQECRRLRLRRTGPPASAVAAAKSMLGDPGGYC
jgi:hypothetical protein